jgi:hypothetical protein
MAFNSTLPAGCLIVTDDNYSDFAVPVRNGVSETGYIPRDYSEQPLGALIGGRRFPKELIIPREVRREMVEERERKGARLFDRLEKSGIFTLDQDPSWYCWCYAATHGVMSTNVSQNEVLRTLCPESVAGPIMNYRKQGGWPTRALEYMVDNGIADTNGWPWESHRQANDRKYYDGSRENAGLTKVSELWDCETWDEKASCLLLGFAVPDGYNYEGHATCSVELIIRDGQEGCIDIDSYFRRNGRKFHARARMGGKAMGSGPTAVRSVTPNQLPATRAA